MPCRLQVKSLLPILFLAVHTKGPEPPTATDSMMLSLTAGDTEFVTVVEMEEGTMA